MHVVSDDGGTLVGYTPVSTEIMYWACPDGSDPRSLPLDQRFRSPLTTAARRWEGSSVLRVIPRDRQYQVVHFWKDDRSFSGWYVNLESSKTEQGRFLDVVDWQLDLWIGPDREFSWKDADEADAALAAGWLTRAEFDRAWAVGREIVGKIDDWPGPIGDWTGFRPPAEWSALALPGDWSV
jgi:hypothetical protein